MLVAKPGYQRSIQYCLIQLPNIGGRVKKEASKELRGQQEPSIYYILLNNV